MKRLTWLLAVVCTGCLPDTSENRESPGSDTAVDMLVAGSPSTAGERSTIGASGGIRDDGRTMEIAGTPVGGTAMDSAGRAADMEQPSLAGTRPMAGGLSSSDMSVAGGTASLAGMTTMSRESCLVIDRLTGPTLFPPAGVRVGFRLLDCAGDAVRPIEADDLTVLDTDSSVIFGEDGAPGQLRLGRPTQLRLFTVVALDLSDATNDVAGAEAIIDAARDFITRQVADQPSKSKHSVMLMAFGQTRDIQVIQDFTQDTERLNSALDSLMMDEPRGPADLYNAYTQALIRVDNAGLDQEMVARFVVMLTAGQHQTGNDDFLRIQALASKDVSEAHIYGIQLANSPDADEYAILATRAEDFIILDADESFDEALSTVTDKVEALSRSHYVVGVCTPESEGTPSLTIRLEVDDEVAEARIAYPVDGLTGEVMDCDLSRIVSDEPPVCAAGSRRCDGQTLVVCDELGISETRTDCSILPGLCLNGACALTICGDGRLDRTEECDDGNDVANDECTNQCTRPRCGDNVIQDFEECDDGNTETEACEYGVQRCTVCALNCRFESGETRFCGDGIVDDEREACDDGNDMDGDGCNSDCTEAPIYRDCVDVMQRVDNAESGRYAIDPDGPGPWRPFAAYCEMNLNEGGWTLVAVISDDGNDNWTWNSRFHWYDGGFYFGSLDQPLNDYRSRAHDRVVANDLLFVHAPSDVWAAYHSVQRGERSHASLYLDGSQCYGGLEPQGFEMTAGTLQARNGLCSTDLFISPLEQDGTSACNTDPSCARSECGTFGPAWSHGISGDGCPLDDPQHSGLGPQPGDLADRENAVLGFANALGLNGNFPGSGINQMRIYARRTIGPRCGNGLVEANEECDDGNQIDFDECSNFCRRPPLPGGASGAGGEWGFGGAWMSGGAPAAAGEPASGGEQNSGGRPAPAGEAATGGQPAAGGA